MRRCVQCGAPDREIPLPGEQSEHYVKPEIRYLDRGEDKWNERLRKKGWAPRTFQGRNAMERMICVDCMNENEFRDRVWSSLKRDARDKEQQPDEDAEFYRVLCQV